MIPPLEAQEGQRAIAIHALENLAHSDTGIVIVMTGFAAKISLARGREKRTKVRPVKIAVKASPQTISVDAIKWPYNVAGYISP